MQSIGDIVLKIKDKSGKVIGVLKDEDTEPTIEQCVKCDGTGWDFKDKSPPFPECTCKNNKQEKETEDANLC